MYQDSISLYTSKTNEGLIKLGFISIEEEVVNGIIKPLVDDTFSKFIKHLRSEDY